MAKKKGLTIFIVIALIVVAVFVLPKLGLFSMSGSETMTRTAPATVNPSSTFSVTYTAVGASGTWGASIQDAVSGGCTFPSGSNSYKTVMLSEDGLTKTITMTAPASGSCTFTGDYQYGTFPLHSFSSLVVNVCSPSCTRPANLCTEASTASNGCGGTCTGSWVVTKNTAADTNCDNLVSRTELGVIITSWTNGQETRTNLGAAIQAWAA